MLKNKWAVFLALFVGCQSVPKSEDQIRVENYLNQNLFVFEDLRDLSSGSSKIKFERNGGVLYYPMYQSSNLLGSYAGTPVSWRFDGSDLIVKFAYETHRGKRILDFKIPGGYGKENKTCSLEKTEAYAWRFSKEKENEYYSKTLFFAHDIDAVVQECSTLFERQDGERLKYLSGKFGKKYAKLILNKQFAIGMTKAMVIESIGEAETVNRTVTSHSVSEQWVYDNVYLYFDGNILRSFQD